MTDPHDRFAAAQSVADAVLYEGYVLYPYRASSTKNQVRWPFGVLMPEAYHRLDPTERCSARAECLVDPGPSATLTVRIRFLHRQERVPEVSAPPGTDGAGFTAVERLDACGVTHVAWDEAVERSIEVGPLSLGPLLAGGEELQHRFVSDGGVETEAVLDGAGQVAGRLVRRRCSLAGRVKVGAESVEGSGGLVRITVAVENASAADASAREEALGHALLALHAMVAVDDGRFVSLLDPPEGAGPAASGCRSDGLYPVLVGDDLVLASPIILYDHPAVAPESPGDLYDATEIDEILALRVLTLTDDEKREARGTDVRAATVIDRCDGMTPEAWDRLHGTFRPVAVTNDSGGTDPRPEVPWWDPTADAAVDPFCDTVVVGGVTVGKGTAVRLRPSRRADAHDLFYRDQDATVAGVFRDVDGTVQVAVILDDDPAREELLWQGRFLFFHPDEVEPRVAPVEPVR